MEINGAAGLDCGRGTGGMKERPPLRACDCGRGIGFSGAACLFERAITAAESVSK